MWLLMKLLDLKLAASTLQIPIAQQKGQSMNKLLTLVFILLLITNSVSVSADTEMVITLA